MQSRADEYNADPRLQESRVPPEYGFPQEYYSAGAEDPVPPEDTLPTEFNDRLTRRRPEKSGDSQRHARIKRLFFIPAASVLAAVSIVCAAFEADPLGNDFLMKDETVSSCHKSDKPQTGLYYPDVVSDLDGEVKFCYWLSIEGGNDDGGRFESDYVDTDDPAAVAKAAESAYGDMMDWARSKGCDPDDVGYIDATIHHLGQRLSDDAVGVGDLDNMEDFHLISGEWIDQYYVIVHYVEYPSSQGKPTSDAITPGGQMITSVVITGAKLSYNVGDTPSHTASVPDDADYFVSHEGWFELDEDGEIVAEWTWVTDDFESTDIAALESWRHSYQADNFYEINGTEGLQFFEAGKTYQYVIVVTPKGGLRRSPWAEGCTLTINGTPMTYDFGMAGLAIIEVTTMTPTNSAQSESFPSLPNLDPDFAGEYAWAGMGSEEYIRLYDPALGSASPYIHAGTAYTSGNALPWIVEPQDMPGVSYDRTTNTLTLDNYSGDAILDVNLMGNGFTIRLIGENHLSQLLVWGAMYGGSVTLTGDGSLTLNETGTEASGLVLEAEQSESCLMIDRQVTLEVFGDPAILITSTRMEKAVYALEPITVTGGTPSGASDGSENPLYDHSVVDEDGNPSRHVIFSPKE